VNWSNPFTFASLATISGNGRFPSRSCDGPAKRSHFAMLRTGSDPAKDDLYVTGLMPLAAVLTQSSIENAFDRRSWIRGRRRHARATPALLSPDPTLAIPAPFAYIAPYLIARRAIRRRRSF
jgi:hypothetical protein